MPPVGGIEKQRVAADRAVALHTATIPRIVIVERAISRGHGLLTVQGHIFGFVGVAQARRGQELIGDIERMAGKQRDTLV